MHSQSFVRSSSFAHAAYVASMTNVSPLFIPSISCLSVQINNNNNHTALSTDVGGSSCAAFVSHVAKKSEMSLEGIKFLERVSDKIMIECGPKISEIVLNELNKSSNSTNIYNGQNIFSFKEVGAANPSWLFSLPFPTASSTPKQPKLSTQQDDQQKENESTMSATASWQGVMQLCKESLDRMTNSLLRIALSIAQGFSLLSQSVFAKHRTWISQSVFLLCCYTVSSTLISQDDQSLFTDCISRVLSAWNEQAPME